MIAARLVLMTIFLGLSKVAFSERLYIITGDDNYIRLSDEIAEVIISLGNEITVDTSNTGILPSGFASTCEDPENGYDWLCFFGNRDYTSYLPSIESFINSGGKVYYQYEVSCCFEASGSISSIATHLTGNLITGETTPDQSAYFLQVGFEGWVWKSEGLQCCANVYGGAYKCLDGIPSKNQLQATGQIPEAESPLEICPNFGFYFTGDELITPTTLGGIVGVGDYNIFYRGEEQYWNGGEGPVDVDAVAFFFPGNSGKCSIFPTGCMSDGLKLNRIDADFLGSPYVCEGSELEYSISSLPFASIVWQDGSQSDPYYISDGGEYWVEVTKNACVYADTATVRLVEDCIDGELFIIPNIFTPNGDGKNDYLEAAVLGNIGVHQMQILNRWGTVIYDASSTRPRWNGNSSTGEPHPEGVYYCVMSYTNSIGESASTKSTVSLKR